MHEDCSGLTNNAGGEPVHLSTNSDVTTANTGMIKKNIHGIAVPSCSSTLRYSSNNNKTVLSVIWLAISYDIADDGSPPEGQTFGADLGDHEHPKGAKYCRLALVIRPSATSRGSNEHSE